MITKNSLEIVSKAIESYLNQSYKNKELIIVLGDNNPNLDYFTSLNIENKKILVESPSVSLGNLRNKALQNISEDLFIQWDDDDIYSKDRIKNQYESMYSNNKDGNLLVGCTINNRGDIYISDARIFQGSILYRKSKLIKGYPNLKRGEDTYLIEHNNILPNVSYIMGYELYEYRIHTNNTYANQYFEIFKNNFKKK